ncbi:MAG: coenzyme F420-0:L-glutamate ligase [Anaerolineales bacterium]
MEYIQFIPVYSEVRLKSFNLAPVVLGCINAAGYMLQPGDILIISSKFVAIAEGRVVTLADVQPEPQAHALAAKYALDPALAALIIQESDHIFGGIPGFVLCAKDNILAPNAGIDTSNIPAGQVVLYPADPFGSAAALRDNLTQLTGHDIGVVLSDSRLMPGRTGTTGVAIGVAGFDPVVDERGKPDLLGRPLVVSQRAVADNLCAGAELLMGEGAEGVPIVVAHGTGVPLTQRAYSSADLTIDYHDDLYVSILGNSPA